MSFFEMVNPHAEAHRGELAELARIYHDRGLPEELGSPVRR